ncbi:hypothetical protein [Serratia fonticola]|uniref:hypothetical protein n=1 Tax=Serratia fonticola TaxID=47917 RepID=UPI00093F234A|nr:hypothetical protein [Serratia fonticola]OKP29376.1 hypothetical protein BSQ40_09135 [Serratia fonticola]
MTTPTQVPVPSGKPQDLLFNAEKFDQVMTGVLLTYTDRLGNIRYTIAGLESKNNDLIASLTANYTNVVNNLTPLGKVYTNLSDANAAISSGEIPVGAFFFIRSVSDKSIADEYQNVAGVATATGKGYPTTQFIESISDRLDDISGDNPVEVAQIFESLDPDIPEAMIITPGNKMLAQFPDPRVSALQGTAVTSGFYESLESSNDLLIVDADDKILGTATSDTDVKAELALAAGSQSSLSKRLNNGLTPFGDPLGPYSSRWSIREVRMRLEKLVAGDPVQLTIGLLGDSYSNDKSYYSMQFAKVLQDKYGMAGVGWIGFGWYGPASGTWTSTTQPVGISGSIRTDLSPICQIIGTWTCTYGVPSTNAPALYKIASSTVGDYVRFTVPPAGGAYANSCRLFYSGDGTGVVQVSWDDGVSWSSNINLATVGAGNINLAGTPAAGGIARIKVVSGNVGVAGVDSQSTAPGVRIHKLGCSGSTAAQWAGVGAQWGNQMTALSCKCHQVMLGTNDQGVATLPSVFAGNLATIFTNLNAILPYSDRALVTPAENQRTTNIYKMPLYAQAAREFALSNDIGYCDLQTFFGSPENYAFAYAYANSSRPWYAADLIHPDGLTGGRAIASALNRFYTQI